MATDRLAVVADGMGGHRGGEVASSVTVAVFEGNQQVVAMDALLALASDANREVFHRSLAEPLLAGMGTTLCAIAVLRADPPTVGVVNVGDSRVYLLERDGLRQLSEDHSFVETLVREGRLTPAQAEVHPQRNVLTRALGIEAEVMIDGWEVECRAGDRFLLCSDGLFNEVSDHEIETVLRREVDPEAAASALVALALEAGGHDNVSCVIADVEDLAESDEVAERTMVRVAGLASTPSEATPNSGSDPTNPGVDRFDDSATERPLVTWRVGLLVLAVLAVLASAAGAAAWWGTRGFELRAVDGQVVEFQGHDLPWRTRPSEPTEIAVDRIDQSAKLREVCDGISFDDRQDVVVYLAELEASLGPAVVGRDCDSLGFSPQLAPETTTGVTTSTGAAVATPTSGVDESTTSTVTVP